MSRRSALLAGCLAAGLLALASAGAAAKDLGFAVTWFMPAFHDAEENCEGGPNVEQDWAAIFRKKGYSEARIKDLFKVENAREFLREMTHRGPNGENVCMDPEADRYSEPWKTVKGKVAHGINLDGTTDGRQTDFTCAHEKFTGPDGTQGIDNQLFRVLGCSNSYRGGRGAIGFAYHTERMREGMVTLLLEIVGLDDPKNDPEVQLILSRGIDPLRKDSSGEVLRDLTLRPYSDPAFRVVMKGSMKDGVLTTEPQQLNLMVHRSWQPSEWHFTAARFRLKLEEDGALKGGMYAYQPWIAMYMFAGHGGAIREKVAGNCPGTYRAFKTMADGGRDPKTGECSLISTAWDVDAVPAFLDHSEENRSAEERVLRTTEAGR